MAKASWVVMGLLAATAACGSNTPPAGHERGPCYGNGTCDPGLSCYSSICVRTGGTGGGGSGGTSGGGGSGGAAAPVVQNGDFETPSVAMGYWAYLADLTGVVWSGAGAGIANGFSPWGRNGHGGSQYAFVQNTASMKQAISGFVPGRTYRITFWMGQRNGTIGAYEPNPIEVTLSGVGSVFGPTAPPSGGTFWNTYVTSPFTATSSSHELTFIGSNTTTIDKTSLIDDVSIGP